MGVIKGIVRSLVSMERHCWAHGPPALLPDLHLAGLLAGGWAPWHGCRRYGNGNGTNRLAGTQGEIFRVVKQSMIERIKDWPLWTPEDPPPRVQHSHEAYFMGYKI